MAEEKKYSSKVIALFAFLPWLVYIVASAGNHWSVATAGGTIMCLIYLAMLRRQTTIKLMDWTTLAFFVTASILTIGLHSAVLATYQVMIIWSFYAVAGWASVVLGRPFTAAYAREVQPPEVWDLPIFHRVNWIMTLFWCGLFSVNVGFGVIALMVGGNLGRLVPGFLIPTGLLIYGFVFSARFPMRYVARVNASGAAGETAESISTA
ncbi:MAG: hypothetical protein WB580_02455 [Candidatus Binataceae bacterium]